MNDIILEIESVFKIISSVPVTGDSIDYIAAARSKLRNVHAKLLAISYDHKTEEVQVDGSNQ